MNEEETIGGVDDFDPSAPSPFCIVDIRAAIPNHCWVKNPWRSLSCILIQAAVVFALARPEIYFDGKIFWPLYWAVQGTLFWAIFVIGHDCGHGSFSDSTMLNNIVGHILHSSILVPYHGWRISHRTHHQNFGNVEKDESWVPWYRSLGKKGSHFNPYSDLFAPNERKAVLTSTVCWTVIVALLVYLSFVFGPLQIFKLYGVPHLTFIIWLDLVTCLHHHGYDKKLPKEWNYLRGGLIIVDRDYGWINNVHRDIVTHVIHHLFPQIPHFHLVDATKPVKEMIRNYYR